MKVLMILFICLMNNMGSQAQKPRQSKWEPANMKQMTDANTSLYNVYSEYNFPYFVPTRENITEKLVRITHFLEKSTAKNIIDPHSGKIITDYSDIIPDFELEKGDFRPYTYEWGVTYSGMFKAARATGEGCFSQYALSRLKLLKNVLPFVEKNLRNNSKYQSPFNPIIKPESLDQSGAMCTAMIQWGTSSKIDFSLRPYIDNYMDWIFNKQFRLEDGTLARQSPYENTLWLDDLYMGVPALSQMYSLTGDEKYLNDAVRQILQFSQRMFVKETSLYMHSYVTTMNPHPELYWGRANGWAVLAMCELLDVMPVNHPQYKALLSQYQAHCWGLLQTQSGRGMWHQLLNRNDSYLESSGTAMFVYGFAKGINRGWLDAKAYGPAALLGWNALSDQINESGQIENVCVGTGISYEPAYYYYRHVHLYAAHGYGPVLMAGAEMITLLSKFNAKEGNSILFFDKKK